MLNTFIPHSMKEAISKNPKNTRSKPESVLKYNATMGGVDKVDQTIKPYQSRRKTLKWYKKIFFHFQDLVMFNSFVLYKKFVSPDITYLKYLLKLIKEIFEAHPVIRKRKGRKISQVPNKSRRLEGTHVPQKICKDNGYVDQRRCFYCGLLKQRKVTSFICKQCNIRLCIGTEGNNCFEKFHSMQKLPGRATTPERETRNSCQIVPESENFDTDDIISDSISSFRSNVEFVIVPETQ